MLIGKAIANKEKRDMLNIIDGTLRINDTLTFFPGFSFEDFKKSDYYNGQDGVKVIFLDTKQIIDDKQYMVSFFFRNNTIYVVSLMNCDKYISETDESKRKIIHDGILKQYNIDNGRQYTWGKVLSEFDRRGNVSSINIYYNCE